jgi:hypothetical protein
MADSAKAAQNQPETSTGLNTDKLAEMLRMVPADKQADFLRALADILDQKTKPTK